MSLAAPRTASGPDEAEAAVRALLARLEEGHRRQDAGLIASAFAPGAVVADLAPPLIALGFDAASAQAWLDGWDGPVEIDTRDLAVAAEGDLALAYGLQFTRAVSRKGEETGWWCRTTLAFRRLADGWRIIHAHSSVPFHMDGSQRAALDLEP